MNSNHYNTLGIYEFNGKLNSSNSGWYAGTLILASKYNNCGCTSKGCTWSKVYSSGSGNNKYIGLSLTNAGHQYYGWIRLDLNPDGTSFTIRDFAYNSVPDQAIYVAQTNVSFIGTISA